MKIVHEKRTADHLSDLASRRPDVVADMVDSALSGLRPLIASGRGGDRNRGALTEKDLVFELGVIFLSAVGRPRGITGDAYAEGDARYTGPFVKFVQIVSAALGRRMSGRKVDHLHGLLKAEEREEDLTQGQRRARLLKRLHRNDGPAGGASPAH